MQPVQIMAICLTALAGSAFACTDGTYQCYNPDSGTATVQVCEVGKWVLAAYCGTGQKCVVDSVGGYTCL
ncbi:Uu.00g028970.m01.CDS01 [Anthostomella pinea]|uniref:Uu.00g028970.m01.CDS01 n=1 Tax=Anthostomella pinea TaxID=933095 RepID=A0AAI8V803_9PEZI|nr:Uu.00g028970.m01.CDS01 [Anthostomella pinea]